MTPLPVYRFVRKSVSTPGSITREPDISGYPYPRAVDTVEVFNDSLPEIVAAQRQIRRIVDQQICNEVQSRVWQQYYSPEEHD